MSLRVWLPLNGNLNNHGLSNISVINNGATVDNNGKLGKCYNFNNGHSISSTVNIASSPISASVWIYLNSFHDQWNYVLSLNNNSGYVDQCIAITLESTVGICFCAGGNFSLKYTHTETLVGKWTHLAVTFDGNTIKGYVNGINVCSLASTAKLTRTNFTLGSRNGTSDYYLNGKLNDIRLYDHCLSPEEVHEISKGLVLHYLMNDHAIAMSKCSNVNWNLLIQNGDFSNGTSGWVGYNDTLTVSNNILHISTAANNRSKRIKYTPIVWDTSHIYLIKYMIKSTAGRNLKTHWYNGNTWTPDIDYTGNWTHIVYRLTNCNQSGLGYDGQNAITDGSACCDIKNVMVIDLTQMFGAGNEPTKEEFEFMFPYDYYPYNTGTTVDLSEPLYDCSGYCYNGSINGTLELDSNTPRYNYSTLFDGSGYISHNANISNATQITISCWAKPNNANLNNLFGNNYNSNTWQFTIGNQSYANNSLGVRDNAVGQSGTRKDYSLGTIEANKWIHFVCSYNAGTVKIYKNGVLYSTNITGGSALNANLNSFLVGSAQINTNYLFDGSISDFRLYSTALSESDVQDLYSLGALISE